MSDKIKNAFDAIRATEELKSETYAYLHIVIKNNRTTGFFFFGKFAFISTFAIVLLLCIFSYNIYFTPITYVDIDVNPSIELTINRFNKVISERAYNEDGTFILSKTDVIYKNYEEAIDILIDTMAIDGYMIESELISVTVQTSNENKADDYILSIKNRIELSSNKYYANLLIDVFSISDEIRRLALEYNLSPAKYLAILELQQLDSTVDFNSCRSHSIGDIKQMIYDHHSSPVQNTEENFKKYANYHHHNKDSH